MKPKMDIFIICIALLLSACSLKSNSSVNDKTLTTEIPYGEELQVALDESLGETVSI